MSGTLAHHKIKIARIRPDTSGPFCETKGALESKAAHVSAAVWRSARRSRQQESSCELTRTDQDHRVGWNGRLRLGAAQQVIVADDRDRRGAPWGQRLTWLRTASRVKASRTGPRMRAAMVVQVPAVVSGCDVARKTIESRVTCRAVRVRCAVHRCPAGGSRGVAVLSVASIRVRVSGLLILHRF